MKITLERKKTARSPSWLDAVALALSVERELKQLNERASVKLTAEAFVAAALASAGATQEKTDTLRRALEADNGRTCPTAARAVRELVAFIRSGNCPRPTAQVGRLRIFDRDGLAAAEIQPLGGAGLLDLQAVAALVAAGRFPESFGTNTNWGAWEERRAQLAEQRTALLQRIEREFTPEDLTFIEPSEQRLRAEGYMRVGFVLTGGAVSVGPGCGERLVSWLLVHDTEV